MGNIASFFSNKVKNTLHISMCNRDAGEKCFQAEGKIQPALNVNFSAQLSNTSQHSSSRLHRRLFFLLSNSGSRKSESTMDCGLFSWKQLQFSTWYYLQMLISNIGRRNCKFNVTTLLLTPSNIWTDNTWRHFSARWT